MINQSKFMTRLRDISGKTFGRWQVVEFSGIIKNAAHWLCRCSCGTEKLVSTNSLLRKVNPSKGCGCYRHASAKDLKGKRFTRLTAVKDVGFNSCRKRVWLCLCDCGVQVQVSSTNLSSGNTKSCGCIKSETSSITGLTLGQSLGLSNRGKRWRGRGKRWADAELNEKAFEVLDEEAAYWVGFLMADGYINRAKKGSADVALCLSLRDIVHVEKLKKFLNSKRKVTVSRGKYPTAIFSVSSDTIADRLTMLGVTQHKTFTAKVDASLALNRHFWRGAIDGDGCLAISKNREKGVSLSLVGSEDMCRQFREYTRSLGCGENVGVLPHSHSTGIFNITLNGREAAKVAHTLYSNSGVYLERKFNLFLDKFHPLLQWATCNKRGHIEWSFESRLKQSIRMKGNQLWKLRGTSCE